MTKRYVVSEDTEIALDGKKYLLEKGDEITLVENPLPAAPTKPKPSTTPSRPKPSEPSKPERDPFKPLKSPKTKPKAKEDENEEDKDLEIDMISKTLDEAYEEEAHVSTINFWENLPSNKSHVFSKHPIMAMHGKNLARKSHEYTSDYKASMPELMDVMMKIMRIEQGHSEQLVQLAKEIVSKIWGIDESMLKAELDQPSESDFEEEDELGEFPEELRHKINKRLTINTMSQGAAVHQMLTAHHMVDKALNLISPELLDLYNRISKGSAHSYWLIDIPALLSNLTSHAVGMSKVNDGKIEAKAIIFPVLVQELSKGVAELISHHGFEDDEEEEIENIIKHSDKMEYEPYQIQIGPEL